MSVCTLAGLEFGVAGQRLERVEAATDGAAKPDPSRCAISGAVATRRYERAAPAPPPAARECTDRAGRRKAGRVRPSRRDAPCTAPRCPRTGAAPPPGCG